MTGLFDPENRRCSAGCPACHVAPSLGADQEKFAEPGKEILGLTCTDKEAIGLCMVGGFVGGTEVVLGEACSFPDADFNRFAAEIITGTALRGTTKTNPLS